MTAKLVAICAAALVSGCQVYSDSWAEAERLCSTNGGVRFVVSTFGSADALCKNGAKFSGFHETRMAK